LVWLVFNLSGRDLSTLEEGDIRFGREDMRTYAGQGQRVTAFAEASMFSLPRMLV